MDSRRTILAIVLSAIILLGYQYLMPQPPKPPTPAPETRTQPAEAGKTAPPAAVVETPAASVPVSEVPPAVADTAALRASRDIPVETSKFSALISEAGGTVKSFRLKNYREEVQKDSPPKELIKTDNYSELPLFFTWGTDPARTPVTLYTTDTPSVQVAPQGEATLSMHGSPAAGLQVTRTLTISDSDYLMHLAVEVTNTGDRQLQGAPYLTLTNRPFSSSSNGRSRYLFDGPALFHNGALQEIKTKDLKEGSKTYTGNIGWAAYEDTYFMCSVIPGMAGDAAMDQDTVKISLGEDDTVRTVLSGEPVLLSPGNSIRYTYAVYFGPKRLSTLTKEGHHLDRIVNFGWWDIIAKPTLHLLNFLYSYLHNYGLAIILVTIIIKLLFWPIAQKGMKSMKTMQKLQPKMAKLREKYKDDKERLNQEMMQLYKTYKVNPVGGCLPMVLQIPVFFALYKVLLQTIELRHAPFMLWINDLSAPDRLHIGVDIPYLGGIPVLTLLMGGSMFLQQKMTPTTGDPTQAKIMMFLPVVFTFMFLNFASGLVLYWFVNNLLSIAQQYYINRQVEV